MFDTLPVNRCHQFNLMKAFHSFTKLCQCDERWDWNKFAFALSPLNSCQSSHKNISQMLTYKLSQQYPCLQLALVGSSFPLGFGTKTGRCNDPGQVERPTEKFFLALLLQILHCHHFLLQCVQMATCLIYIHDLLM